MKDDFITCNSQGSDPAHIIAESEPESNTLYSVAESAEAVPEHQAGAEQPEKGLEKSSAYPFDLDLCSPMNDWGKADLDISVILPEQQALDFCYSEDKAFIASVLGLENWGQPGGVWLHSGIKLNGEADPHIQAKPEHPFTVQGKSKPSKYLTPAGLSDPNPILPRWSKPAFDKLKAKYPEAFADFTEAITQQGEVLGVWSAILAHPEIFIIVAEGAKKAESLISLGIPAFSISGCWMAGVLENKSTGKHYLSDWWLDWQGKGRNKRTFYIAYDGDNQSNILVAKPLLYLALKIQTELKQEPKILDWDDSAKGIDDFIAEYGEAGLDERLGKAKSLDRWVQTHTLAQDLVLAWKAELSTKKPIDPNAPREVPISEQGNEYLEIFGDNLAYDFPREKLMIYGHVVEPDQDIFALVEHPTEAKKVKKGKCWNLVEEPIMLRSIIDRLEKDNVQQLSLAYPEGVLAWMKARRPSDFKNQHCKFTGFSNGVVNLAPGERCGELLPHSPEFKLTFCRDFPYNPRKLKKGETLLGVLRDEAPYTFNYLYDSFDGHEQEMMRLIAAFKSFFCFWLQKMQVFLLVTGKGGSGKSVLDKWFSTAIFPEYGKSHIPIVASIEWPQFTSDQQTRYDVVTKSLALILSEITSIGSGDGADLLKKISAHSLFTIRGLYKENISMFYEGNLLLIGNNNPLAQAEQGDKLAGAIERRKVRLHYPKPVSEDKKIDELEYFLIQELPAFLNLVLPMENMSYEQAKALLKQKSDFALLHDNECDNDEDYMYNFINEYLVYEPGSVVYLKDATGKLMEYREDFKHVAPNTIGARFKKALSIFNKAGWHINYIPAEKHSEAGIKDKVACLYNTRWRTDADTSFKELLQARAEQELRNQKIAKLEAILAEPAETTDDKPRKSLALTKLLPGCLAEPTPTPEPSKVEAEPNPALLQQEPEPEQPLAEPSPSPALTIPEPEPEPEPDILPTPALEQEEVPQAKKPAEDIASKAKFIKSNLGAILNTSLDYFAPYTIPEPEPYTPPKYYSMAELVAWADQPKPDYFAEKYPSLAKELTSEKPFELSIRQELKDLFAQENLTTAKALSLWLGKNSSQAGYWENKIMPILLKAKERQIK